jgi:hypothetical protein
LVSRSFDAAAAQRALRRGVDRLIAIAGQRGWHGFRTLAGDSDVWVTAFVVAHVGPATTRRATVGRARGDLAAAQTPSGGWTFGGDVPPDADSTAWALLALERTRLLDAERRRRAGEFLAEHVVGDGYATYRQGSGIAEFIGAGTRSVEGWTSEHPDVTAAVLAAGPPGTTSRERLTRLAALVARQTGAGWWPAYWWRSPQYTTALLLRALRRHERALPSEQRQRLVNAFAREQLPEGGFPLGASPDADAFSTALALDALCHIGGDEAASLRKRSGAALLAAQLEDGGWLGDFQLRIPPPDVRDPELVRGWSRGGRGGGSFVLDRDGIFATAQACAGLERWLAVERHDVPDFPAVPRLPPRDQPDVMEALASLPAREA